MPKLLSFPKTNQKIFISLIAMIVTITLFVAIELGIKVYNLSNDFWVSVLLLPVMLIGFHYQHKLSDRQRSALIGIMLAAILMSCLSIIKIMIANIAKPPEWDFLGFWLNGKVAVQGLNFYQPEYATQLAQPFNPSREFTTEILNVGFWYPPPSIFIFLPLGWFDIHNAYFFWYVVHSIILIADVYLLWKIFVSESKLLGLMFVTVLLLTLNAKSTVIFGQTNFLLMLMFLLFWRDRNHTRGGIWLALGILVKPLLGAVFLYLFLLKKWRTIIITIATLCGLSVLTILSFGSETFFSYFTPSHYGNLPNWVYTEPTNQSLLATILRITKYQLTDNASPMMQPVFISLAIIFTGITSWLIIGLRKRDDDWALALILLLTLTIYPVSQMFYSIFLVVPILLLWEYRRKLPIKISIIVGLITIQYAIVSYASGIYIFVATMLNWLTSVILAAWLIKRDRVPLDSEGIGADEPKT